MRLLYDEMRPNRLATPQTPKTNAKIKVDVPRKFFIYILQFIKWGPARINVTPKVEKKSTLFVFLFII